MKIRNTFFVLFSVVFRQHKSFAKEVTQLDIVMMLKPNFSSHHNTLAIEIVTRDHWFECV